MSGSRICRRRCRRWLLRGEPIAQDLRRKAGMPDDFIAALAAYVPGAHGSQRMSPRYGWVLNLDAELELAQPSYNPRRACSSQLEQYGAGSRALLGPEDVLVTKRDERCSGADRARLVPDAQGASPRSSRRA